MKVNEIATRLDVHHSTVRLILGTARAARDAQRSGIPPDGGASRLIRDVSGACAGVVQQ